MSIINNGLLLASGADAAVGYQISRSLRFNSADSAYLSRTPGSAGNRKTYTFSCWLKRSKLGTLQYVIQAYGGGTYRASLFFDTDDTLYFALGNTSPAIRTNAVFRDVSAWYHIVLAIDTTQSTQSAGMKLYVNGTQQTVTNSGTYTQNDEGWINSTSAHQISGTSGYYLDGYLADIYFLDGTATTPSTFAETDAITGQWVPKTPTGISYGTNGFRLTFSDNSGTTSTTLGKDAAGSNNWTPNNFSVASGSGNDSLVDSPTSYGTDTGAGAEVRGNYATFNPLNVQIGAGSLSNGNLDLTGPSGSSAYNYAGGTFGIDTSTSTGWYFEFTQTTYGQFASIGLLDQSVSASALNNLYIIGHSFANQTAGISYSNGGSIGNYGTLTTGLTSWTSSGDVIGVAIKDNKIWFAKNNTWISGSPSAGTSPSITLASTKYVTPAAIGINSSVLSLNAGQRAFAYTAPSGFKCLCDTSLPLPVVAKPSDYFETLLYTGNGSARSITGLNFSPDFVWIKKRSASGGHPVFDTVRGATNFLQTHSTGAEGTDTDALTAFNSNGFSLGTGFTTVDVNQNGATYVAWAWDAASSNSTNTSGTITSTVRANATAGFSIVTYTGTGANATVGHGLGVQPQFIIIKCRDSASDPSWIVSHTSIGLGSGRLILNTTDANTASGASVLWNSTAPTSSVFSLGNYSSVNGSTLRYVAYCFAPVAGYSAFGSYTGNGSTDGPFVFTGHRSRWLMVKRSDSGANDWYVLDTARSTYNVAINELLPNSSSAENPYTGVDFDLLSNGFKIRATEGSINASGGTFIYASFAEFPFAYARAR